jgi:hypothetical protein
VLSLAGVTAAKGAVRQFVRVALQNDIDYSCDLIHRCLGLFHNYKRQVDSGCYWGFNFYFYCLCFDFFSGSIARSVLAPGPPAKSTIDNFYLGIQLLQNELFDCYLLVIYLSFLGFINAVWGNKRSK